MSDTTHWYALVDGAADPRIAGTVRLCRDHAWLFSGDATSDLATVTPWLARIAPGEPLLDAWQGHGHGKHWGLMIESSLDLAALRKMLRVFLLARLPDGEVVTFRFYDPRVFRGYITSAPADQLGQWFDGVRQYAVEGEGDVQHSFRLRGGRLFDGDRPLAAAV